MGKPVQEQKERSEVVRALNKFKKQDRKAGNLSSFVACYWENTTPEWLITCLCSGKSEAKRMQHVLSWACYYADKLNSSWNRLLHATFSISYQIVLMEKVGLFEFKDVAVKVAAGKKPKKWTTEESVGECWFSWFLPVLKMFSPCASYLDSIFGYFPKCDTHGGGIVRRPVFTNQNTF